LRDNLDKTVLSQSTAASTNACNTLGSSADSAAPQSKTKSFLRFNYYYQPRKSLLTLTEELTLSDVLEQVQAIFQGASSYQLF